MSSEIKYTIEKLKTFFNKLTYDSLESSISLSIVLCTVFTRSRFSIGSAIKRTLHSLNHEFSSSFTAVYNTQIFITLKFNQ